MMWHAFFKFYSVGWYIGVLLLVPQGWGGEYILLFYGVAWGFSLWLLLVLLGTHSSVWFVGALYICGLAWVFLTLYLVSSGNSAYVLLVWYMWVLELLCVGC